MGKFKLKSFAQITDEEMEGKNDCYLYLVKIFDKDTKDLIASKHTNNKKYFEKIVQTYQKLGCIVNICKYNGIAL